MYQIGNLKEVKNGRWEHPDYPESYFKVIIPPGNDAEWSDKPVKVDISEYYSEPIEKAKEKWGVEIENDLTNLDIYALFGIKHSFEEGEPEIALFAKKEKED